MHNMNRPLRVQGKGDLTNLIFFAAQARDLANVTNNIPIVSASFMLIATIMHQLGDMKINRERGAYLEEQIKLSVMPALCDLYNKYKFQLLPKQLIDNLNYIYKILTEIQVFLQKFVGLNWFKQFFLANNKKEQFLEYQQRLDTAIRNLNLSISIAVFNLQEQHYQECQQRDLRLIVENRNVVIALQQMSIYYASELEQRMQALHQALHHSLYIERQQFTKAIMDLKTELAIRDARLAIPLNVSNQQIQVNSSDALLQLQMCEINQQFDQNVLGAGQTVLSIDSKWLIPLHEIQLNATPFANNGDSHVYFGKRNEDPVIIKIVPNIYTQEQQELFTRGVNIIFNLQRSKYIAKFVGANFTKQHGIIVLNYYANGNLANYLATKQLTLLQKRQLMLDIAEGLKDLHDNNIVHKNFTSANILIDSDESPKISDFTLSSASQNFGIMSTQQKSMSLEYMAPEYWDNNIRLTKMADIYSLGIILLEIATSKQPTLINKNYLTREHNNLRIEALKKISMPLELKSLIIDCLNYDPESRTNSVDVIERLKSIVFRSPSPDGLGYYKQGIDYQKSGKLQEALFCYKKSQQKGYFKAFTEEGFLQLHGQGCTQNKSAALSLFTQAADVGHTRAMINLASMYAHGDGVEKNYKRAYELAKKALDCGDSSAQEYYNQFKLLYEEEERGPRYLGLSLNP